ncbi:hypothetical protein [Pedobacter rhodius]|uniref:Uncharacterized protein n=1 Tax=Pedobacter rhodius TaxID=3004098 RepID=A0ABT4L0V3_9SPHI|nr:hypothetical protein [Pedobacter sp. SJ11]MCZ4224816.1 hypothetical protein [Pedobacter sp. SJ11]
MTGVMEKEFTIDIALKLKNSKLSYGRFILGSDKDVALEIFRSLKGNRDTVNTCTLELELIENVTGFPIPIDILNCTLQELAENITLLSKEIFRIAQLENGKIQSLH